MLKLGAGRQTETDLITGVHGQNVSAAGAGEGALVASGVRPVDGRTIAEIGSRVGREFNWVVLCFPGRLPDIFISGLDRSVDDVGVEPVMRRNPLGHKGGNRERRKLHINGVK